MRRIHMNTVRGHLSSLSGERPRALSLKSQRMLRGLWLKVAWLLSFAPAWLERQSVDHHCHCNCTCSWEVSNPISWKWELFKILITLRIGLAVGTFSILSKVVNLVEAGTGGRKAAHLTQGVQDPSEGSVALALQAQGQIEALKRRREQ